MNTKAEQVGNISESVTGTEENFSSPLTKPPTPSTKISVEVPPSTVGWNPFDPSWVKGWEQAGPVSFLILLCLLVLLLTRFVEAVKKE